MTKLPKGHTPNAALRRARQRLNMSQDDVVRALRAAGWSSCERRTLQRYESGEVTRPQYESRGKLSEVLQVPIDELGFDLIDLEGQQQHPPPSPSDQVVSGSTCSDSIFVPPVVTPTLEGIEEMRRRTFALGMATVGLSAAGLSTVDATASASEALRHGLLASTADDDLVTELEEWEILVNDYAIRHLTTPPAALLRSYLTDLQQLNMVLCGRHQRSSPDLFRVAAVLTSFTAWTYANLEAVNQAGRWWRTAHRLASASGDPHTRVWVSAQEAIMALYQGTHPVEVIIEAIQKAEPLAAKVPDTPAAAWLFCGKAQALGMAGRADEAEDALRRLRDTFAGLPSFVTNDKDSFLGWPETRLRYTESFAYSHLGNYKAASAAQDQALGLFSAAVLRDPLKVELQRALCLARSGDSADAARHAVAQLSVIDQTQHDLPMADLAARVLRSLSRSPSSDEITELHQYVSSRPLSITA
jgi:transcriptional regulator with XRE-family HTH domain/tetratricopeptide (TPR) repeat protein